MGYSNFESLVPRKNLIFSVGVEQLIIMLKRKNKARIAFDFIVICIG
jgi:hypothetical protein